MWLFSLLNPTTWMQSAVVGALCLTIGGSFGFLKGYEAANVKALHSRIKALNVEREALIKASEAKDAQIKADADQAEHDREQLRRINDDIKNALQTVPSGACRLSDDELRKLRSIADR